jgi:acetoin utilization protein AcuB
MAIPPLGSRRGFVHNRPAEGVVRKIPRERRMIKKIMEHMPPIKAVMTPFPHFIELSDALSAAQRMMDKHRIHHLPVVNEGRLVGVLSLSDIRQLREPEPRGRSRPLTVGDARVAPAYVVELSEPLDRVLEQMASRHLESALVVKGGKLAGIFTMTDAFRSFAEFLRAIFPGGDGDNVA